MTVAKHVRRVEAVLESPFLSQGLWAYAPGLDTALARDRQGELIIPGSLVRGVLRQIMQGMLPKVTGGELTQADLVKWFGEKSGGFLETDDKVAKEKSPEVKNPFDPIRGRAHFGDLLCQRPVANEGATTTRIAIEEETGSVKRGMLQVLEQPFPLGAEVPFLGEVAFYGEDDEAARFWQALGVAMQFVSALGSTKSSGFGYLAREMAFLPNPPASRPLVVEPTGASASSPLPDRLCLDMEVLDPFLVDAELIGDNIYQGSQIIPGAVIKGCLARMLELATGKLDGPSMAALERLLISHAFPVKADDPQARRPRQIPLSAILCQGRLYDCLAEDDKETWETKLHAYQVDWKRPVKEAASRAMGWPKSPDIHTRTRTAINAEKEVAQSGQLFSYRMVDPKGLRWRFWLDRGQDGPVEGNAFGKLVAILESGLEFLGKSGARARCRRVVDVPTEVSPRCQADAKDTLWRVTLQTPALMLDTASATRQSQDSPPLDLAKLYVDYWTRCLTLRGGNLAGQGIKIESFAFRAAQKWEGGYRARRYRKDTSKYEPNLLTLPGSVFIMRIKGPSPDEQKRFFARLCRQGLPLHDAEHMREPERWRQCAYTPENGYGEVRVDWLDAERFKGGVCCD